MVNRKKKYICIKNRIYYCLFFYVYRWVHLVWFDRKQAKIKEWIIFQWTVATVVSNIDNDFIRKVFPDINVSY